MALHKEPYGPQRAKINLWLCHLGGKGYERKGREMGRAERWGKLQHSQQWKKLQHSQQSQEYCTSNWWQQHATVVIPTPSCVSLHQSHALGTGVVPSCPPRHVLQGRASREKATGTASPGSLGSSQWLSSRVSRGSAGIVFVTEASTLPTDMRRGLHHHKYLPEFRNKKTAEYPSRCTCKIIKICWDNLSLGPFLPSLTQRFCIELSGGELQSYWTHTSQLLKMCSLRISLETCSHRNILNTVLSCLFIKSIMS